MNPVKPIFTRNLPKSAEIYMKPFFYTERNNPENLQYERFFNLHEDFICTLHDCTCRLLSIAVQDVERKGNPVNLTAFTGLPFLFFNRNTDLK